MHCHAEFLAQFIMNALVCPTLSGAAFDYFCPLTFLSLLSYLVTLLQGELLSSRELCQIFIPPLIRALVLFIKLCESIHWCCPLASKWSIGAWHFLSQCKPLLNVYSPYVIMPLLKVWLGKGTKTK